MLFSSSGEFDNLELVQSNESEYENKATPAETNKKHLEGEHNQLK